jgi:hypothetical protein
MQQSNPLKYTLTAILLAPLLAAADKQSLLSDCVSGFTINADFDQFIVAAPSVIPEQQIVALNIRWRASRRTPEVEGTTDKRLKTFFQSVAVQTLKPMVSIRSGCGEQRATLFIFFIPGKATNEHRIDRWVYRSDNRIEIYLK